MADKIKTYVAPAGKKYGNPNRLLVNESKKKYNDSVYSFQPSGMIINVKNATELKRIKEQYVKDGFKSDDKMYR